MSTKPKFNEDPAREAYFEAYNGRGDWPGLDVDSFIEGAKFQFNQMQSEIEAKEIENIDNARAYRDQAIELEAKDKELKAMKDSYASCPACGETWVNMLAVDSVLLEAKLEIEREKVEILKRDLVKATAALLMIKDCELGKFHGEDGSRWAEDIARNALKESE